MKNSDNKNFIEFLKEISTREEGCFIVFDKIDATLKININESEMKMQMQKQKKVFYSKVDAKINDRIEPVDIIKTIKHIPIHLGIRLEADHIKQMIKLMKSKSLIKKLKEQGIKFLYKGIEIEPRIIESKIDEDDLKNEVKEKEAKRDRLNMDCDK